MCFLIDFVCAYVIIHTIQHYEEPDMAHEDNKSILDSTEISNEDKKTSTQQLTDARNEIADLKMQIAWLERSYE